MAAIGLAVVGVAAPVAAQDFHWNGQLFANQTIEIKGVNGDIRAVPSDSTQAEVTAVKTARRSNPADVRIEVVPHSGGVTICAVYPDVLGREPNRCEPGSGGHNETRNNDTSVQFTVKVPAGVVFVGRAVNGDVETASLQGAVEAHSVNGAVTVDTAGYAVASSVNGSITVSMDRTDWPVAANFKTVNGSITLKMPESTGAQLRADTVNGSIVSDFPIAVTGTISPRRLRGTIGSGGPELTVSTVNGSIKLLRKR
jgi:DUF4097 and DUF4098 domain-containing protein YvlB